MIIAIDGNEANVRKRVGSNVYAFQILKNIHKEKNSRLRQGYGGQAKGAEFVVYLKEKPLEDMPKETSWWKYEVIKPKFLWTQWRLPLALFQRATKPDVFFTPGHYGPLFCVCPMAVSIMDLAFLVYPRQFRPKDLYQLKKWTERSLKKAAKIFAISEATKNDIIKYYLIEPEKILVTYPAVNKVNLEENKAKAMIKNLKSKHHFSDKYFIFISTLQPRKNLVRLIQAFKKIVDQEPDMSLLIVGKKGWLYEEIFSKVKELGLEEKVIFTGFVSEGEKQALLKNAFAFVLPSLYEGFGFPVLEAMNAGCPVIVSQVSSLPEVAGEACIYIRDPQSIDSIYQALEQMINLSKDKRKALINKGYRQAKKFSWEKTAQQTLEALKKLK